MAAFNIVRLRVKPNCEEEFLAAHRKADTAFAGFRRGVIVKTGERSYCFVGEWTNLNRLAAARPKMIAVLDSFRDCLEDLGPGLGATDPVSGEAVLTLKPKAKSRRRTTTKRAAKKAPKKAPQAKRKAAKRKKAKKAARR